MYFLVLVLQESGLKNISPSQIHFSLSMQIWAWHKTRYANLCNSPCSPPPWHKIRRQDHLCSTFHPAVGAEFIPVHRKVRMHFNAFSYLDISYREGVDFLTPTLKGQCQEFFVFETFLNPCLWKKSLFVYFLEQICINWKYQVSSFFGYQRCP